MKISLILLSILALFLSGCSFIEPDTQSRWHPTFTWHDYQPSTPNTIHFDLVYISGDTVKNTP